MSNSSSPLNLAQSQAVNTLRGPLLILAGAGSGKTRVITYRTLELLKRGIRAQNILLLTFTNKAANEMKDRLKHLVETSSLKGITISTFHSLGLHILSKNIRHLGFDNRFSICQAEDQKQTYFEVYKNLKLDHEEMPDEDIRSAISLAKGKMVAPEDYPINIDFDKVVKAVYFTYQKQLRHYNFLDFDDLLYYTGCLFRDFPKILDVYQKKYHYIMIDEYQDTNYVQYYLAKRLSEKHQNLCVVGDDDQSIYSWRGANINNILDFEKDFKKSTIIKLEENYRSTSYILQAANAVIRHNQERKGKELFSKKDKGKRIRTLEGNDPWDEAQKIGEDIMLKRLKYNRSYRDFAILYRTNGQSKPLEDVFSNLNIPFHVNSQYDFYNRKEIKDVLAYLKFIHNPNDDLSFLRIVNFPKRGIGVQTIKKIKDSALLRNTSFFESLKHQMLSPTTSLDLATAMHGLIDVIENCPQDINSSNMAQGVQRLLEEVGFFNAFYQSKEDAKVIEHRIQNVRTLIETIDAYAQKNNDPSLKNYLIRLALFHSGKNEEEEGFSEDSVHFLTIHATKGLEFPYVYIIGFEENYLPFMREETQRMNVDEERRLCYVAMTRSQKELVISLCKERSKMGQKYIAEPSRFLSEIPDTFIVRSYGIHVPTHEEVLKKESSSQGKNIDQLAFDRINSLFANVEKERT